MMAYTINLSSKNQKSNQGRRPGRNPEQILQDKIDAAQKELNRARWELRLYKKNYKKWAEWKTQQIVGKHLKFIG